jgi:hypothetical protein
MFALIDLVGQKFGRLTVMHYAGATKKRHSLWTCVCRCGRSVVVRGTALTNGLTRSCGCLQRELSAERSRARAKARRIAACAHAF